MRPRRALLLVRRLLPRALWTALGVAAPLLLLIMSLNLAGRPTGSVSAQPDNRLPAQVAQALEPTAQPSRPAATPTRAPTATATRQATPTWTPFPTATSSATPTATPVAGSPLGFLASQTAPIASVPPPQGLFGPRLKPITQTAPLTVTDPLTEGTASAASDENNEGDENRGAGGLWGLLPTPTPTPAREAAPVSPTLPITAALQMTVSVPLDEPSPPVEPAPTEIVQGEVVQAEPPPATPALSPTPDGQGRTVRVPILMYHYLSVPPADADRYRVDLSVTPERFAAHLDAMQQAGYTTISFYALLAHLTQGAPLPEKPVILTFDDGYRDNYENAFPLLRAHGMAATFFIVTDFIDKQLPEYLTWDMVREMYAAGMSIESHGRNHVSLANKDRDYLIWQALGSLETIQFELGVRPRFVSYPAGEYDPLTIEVFQSAGYWAGVTTAQGATHHSDDLFRLKRVRVRNSTTSEELLRLLALDW